MEVRRRLLGRDDGDVAGQYRVQRFGRPLDRRPARHVDRDDVGERVHAGVGAAGDDELRPAGEDRFQRLAQHTLHRAQTRLRGPAAEGRAVVLER